jgi:hypothetical protein
MLIKFLFVLLKTSSATSRCGSPTPPSFNYEKSWNGRWWLKDFYTQMTSKGSVCPVLLSFQVRDIVFTAAAAAAGDTTLPFYQEGITAAMYRNWVQKLILI